MGTEGCLGLGVRYSCYEWALNNIDGFIGYASGGQDCFNVSLNEKQRVPVGYTHPLRLVGLNGSVNMRFG